MKALVIGLLMAVIGVQAAIAQDEPRPQAGGRSRAEQQIVDLSSAKWRWMSNREIERLDALFDQNAVFVHMGGSMSKAQELDVIRTGAIHYKDAQIQDVSVRFVGDTAILLNRIRLVAVVGGAEVVNPFVVTEVYVRQAGAWKLGALSFTRLLDPPGAVPPPAD